MKRVAVVLLLGVLAVAPVPARADTAEVLPKGNFAVDATYYHYFDITERYGADGSVESLAVDYNGELNSSVFLGLALLDPYVGGSANVGSSVVDFTRVLRWSEFNLQYGLTDKISLGVKIPYKHTKSEVRAELDTSKANVGKNPALNSLAPLGVPGTEPLTADDVQNLLGPGLDINGDGTIEIPGYGYDRVETWSGSSVGDIEIGGRYQFHSGEKWQAAFDFGFRLPTGTEDDPDNLVDVATGDGQTDLLFRLHTDYSGFKDLLLDATFRYDLQLPDSTEVRISEDVNNPFTRVEQRVDRDLGDGFDVELLAAYSLTPAWSTAVTYTYSMTGKDEISGDTALDYSSLEEETDVRSHMVFLSLSYSTIQKFLDKQFPVPGAVTLEYRNRFAGENNVTKSQYISAGVKVFF